ncbi:hypothetical protein BDZ89DRAFT_1042046 [Hymenopellis radicata]|nr:hypothetical protein BDZ89DRAFT_1042046 [Hymenopellis radicata]
MPWVMDWAICRTASAGPPPRPLLGVGVGINAAAGAIESGIDAVGKRLRERDGDQGKQEEGECDIIRAEGSVIKPRVVERQERRQNRPPAFTAATESWPVLRFPRLLSDKGRRGGAAPRKRTIVTHAWISETCSRGLGHTALLFGVAEPGQRACVRIVGGPEHSSVQVERVLPLARIDREVAE